MRWYLSHAAMIMLGVTLTVGFYEGRRLVKNTAKALGATGTVSAASARRSETEELRERLAEAEDKLARRAASRSERAEDRTRRRARADELPAEGADPSAMSRAERIQMMRDRRLRMSEGAAGGAPLAVRPGLDGGVLPPERVLPPDGFEEELVDTGLLPPP